MLQRLPIALLAQVKVGHTSENLLNEIRQKKLQNLEITKKYIIR